MKFDVSFDMADPWTQRAIYHFCTGTAPELKVNKRHCWVIHFKRWLAARDQDFPLKSTDFYKWFFQYSVHVHGLIETMLADGSPFASDASAFDCLWLADDGKIEGTFATFEAVSPAWNDRDLMKMYIKLWQQYLDDRNGMFEGKARAWMASPAFAQSQTIDAVRHSAAVVVFVTVFIALVVTFLLTCSCGITLAVIISMCISLCSFVTFWAFLGKRDVTSLEVISLSVFFTGLAAPLIRIAIEFSYARDHPHLPTKLLQKAKSYPNLTFAGGMEASDDLYEEHPLLFPGAINSERQNRVATALQISSGATIGFGCAAICGGLSFVPLQMEALGQVGVAILCLGFAVVPAALGFLPLLILSGLGDSRARKAALGEVAWFLWEKCRRCCCRHMSDHQDLMHHDHHHFDAGRQANEKKLGDHTVAAIMLGVPVGIATGKPWMPPMPTAMMKRSAKKADKPDQNADDDIEESGPVVMTLDVQGATARPPNHVVTHYPHSVNLRG
jgi:hypothetical protein